LHTDKEIKAASLDERAVAAKQSELETNALIKEFMPFLHGRAAIYSAQYNEHLREDLLSAAMMAFYEAIRNYDAEKGHFFPFANRVIRARIIDSIRKTNQHGGKTVSLDEDDFEQPPAQSTAIREASLRNYSAELRRQFMAEEIEQFKAELALWGITMDALVSSSPKHKELRATYRELISQIAKSPDIMQTIQLKRYFPIKEIQKMSDLPHKKIERARTFILASLIIKTGDYDLLSGYIDEGGR